MPDTLTPVHPLLRGILDHPRERDRLLVYADWLEEHGVSGPCGRCKGEKRIQVGSRMVGGPIYHRCKPCGGTGRTDAAALALGWRLLAGEGKWPYLTRHVSPGSAWWLIAPNPAYGSGETLPGDVCDRLAARADEGRRYATYPSIEDALADAARAYGLAYLAGWRPKEARRGH